MAFSHFFHVICHAKSERLSWCQNRTLFRTDDFLSSILFYSDSSDSFSVRRSMRTTLFLRFISWETSHCTYVPIWLTYACMLKKNGIFVTKQSMDCFGCGLSKRQFWKIVADLIFHRSRFASDFCANVDGQYGLFFLLGPKIIDTTDNCFWRDKRMWRFIVRPNLAQISAKKAGHVAAFFGRESSPFCRIKSMSFYLTKVREHLKRNV